MNKLLSVSLLSIAALLPLRAQAQVLCTLGPAKPYESLADMPPSPVAQAELKKVKALLCPKGCGKVFLFANATTPNAATATDGAGASKIAYSPSFVSGIHTTYGPIATLGIVAHGLGHHLEATGNRPAWMKASWDSELRADAWAGCAMAKAELTPSRLQAALLALSTYPSEHHPAWNVRRPVITEGYTQCGGRLLPPLAKEATEPPPLKAGEGKEDTARVAAAPGGCTSSKDCRNGRVCMNSRCAAAPEHGRCGKDTDCPEPQECDAGGFCSGPAIQARAADEPPKPAGPVLASLQSPNPAPPPAAPAKDASACQRACDDARNQCAEAATSEVNKCMAAIQSEANYRACSCPNYPSGDFACYSFCTSSYERGKKCSTANQTRDCRAESDRCRAQCQ
jgi:hypothetical protein